MDKGAIKKYAVWAREQLIEKITTKAIEYEIVENKTLLDDLESINGVVLSDIKKNQRKALINKIKQDGYKQVMEEVAYTWFNRFVAIRFMEVNGYLPSHIRVFSDENDAFNPQILTEALHIELDGLDKNKVLEYKELADNEGLFKYLLLVQCNSLSTILPRMFSKIEDYMELLLPDYLLRSGSVIEQLVNAIPEDDWKDQVQIIGWLYQYYNSVPKDEVFAALKKNVKISKENIPAATQLFTPDWIVRYMVENSLGFLWLEGHPNSELEHSFKHYISDSSQDVKVIEEIKCIREEYANLNPADIKCIDPCMGSGHILCYLFDVLIDIYEAFGYSSRDAVEQIIQNNIWGLDIDERAAQLSYFAVMMKARQYDRRFFSKNIQPNIYCVRESNNVSDYVVDEFCDNDELRSDVTLLLNELHDAKEYGSIIKISNHNWNKIFKRFETIKDSVTLFREDIMNELYPMFKAAFMLNQKYDVVITNPPYMGIRNMTDKMNTYVSEMYPKSKYDLFSIMIERCRDFAKKNGLYSLVTMHSWMNLASFEELRDDLLCQDLITMLHLGAYAFGNDVGSIVQNTAFVFRKNHIEGYIGKYYRLTDYTSSDEKESAFLEGKHLYETSNAKFLEVPRHPFCYWISEAAANSFVKFKSLGEVGKPRQGMASSDNNRFVRKWYEVDLDKICFGAQNAKESSESGCKWFPYNNGGGFRKWYGNNYDVVNWENDGREVKEYAASLYKSYTRTIKSISEYFKAGATWNAIATSDNLSVRYFDNGFIFSNAGMAVFGDDIKCIAAFMNSKVAAQFLQYISPTYNCNQGDIALLPISDEIFCDEIRDIAQKCISLCKDDWDDCEISWDFKKHPLVMNYSSIELAYLDYETKQNAKFELLKTLEEQLNQKLIDIYDLGGEMISTVEDEKISIQHVNKEECIKSLISYAVGCMFGRYSLDSDGLICAGHDINQTRYITYVPDVDGIIPITDDEYFSDDIVGLFVEFIEKVYGKETLEENLKFISDALGGKGSSRDVIRNYFLNSFYNDHIKMYQKRPIYWLFDSGKKNGFKCLVYMHRYKADTIARIRTDYVHEQQARYRTAIEEVSNRVQNASGSDKVKMSKKLNRLKAQEDEIFSYEEKIHHLADQMISINLDDGVKKNYEIFKDVLAKIK
ncbi:MAG: BREX-1 system adenine-specific DNA-methyltransferase PglX [Lachnospiraceae bacterium]|nr:BREX-1 system adenine-specific DNA-methyltransferase PglX [Lachnospiraceae bacterium]